MLHNFLKYKYIISINYLVKNIDLNFFEEY